MHQEVGKPIGCSCQLLVDEITSAVVASDPPQRYFPAFARLQMPINCFIGNIKAPSWPAVEMLTCILPRKAPGKLVIIREIAADTVGCTFMNWLPRYLFAAFGRGCTPRSTSKMGKARWRQKASSLLTVIRKFGRGDQIAEFLDPSVWHVMMLQDHRVIG
jgi:hypothetical protein